MRRQRSSAGEGRGARQRDVSGWTPRPPRGRNWYAHPARATPPGFSRAARRLRTRTERRARPRSRSGPCAARSEPVDGLHASYVPERTPLAEGGALDTAQLAPFVAFARRAAADRAAMLVTHPEIFPGTFASTTETTDYLL